MRVTESAVELDVKLGFLLRPFRASLEEHIERHLTERLSGPVVAKAAKNSRKA
jgi:hypothetical protein